ncbi:peroxisomal targeting signal receptor [Candidozyma duobushaemuli]|uniref:Peroxisomal targeting signal receptor n=1 Tax=Candidozyma duobushaemuli TaxID=1231522 RepID=A0A2V1A7I2_9ASCO|nr:peroxisomal targeting signal receptor [[Candida] duobushaemulonis]PVH13625.1 peroxisomal targeting signal receptor [[Candida] duobushaemulonis]
MSFFGGADCSVNGNAVAQLNKHTQQDRSLQRQTNQPGQVSNQGFKNDKMMNQRDLEQFMGSGSPSPSPFQFQPMRHELNRIQSSSQPSAAANQQNWLNEFNAQIYRHRPRTLNNTQWASEFGQAPQAQHQQNHMQQNRMPMMNYRPMMGMGMNSMGSSSMQQQHQQQQPQAETADASVDWDNQFKEIEQLSADASAAEEVAAEKEDVEAEPVIDDKYQATFQEVWDSLNSDSIENDFISQQYEEFKNSQGETYPPSMSQWERDFAKYASTRAHFGDYKFESNEQNQFLDLPQTEDPYQIGLQLMENGAKLSEAALAFEAAISRDSSHVQAWLKLGEVQTQNEKEVAGITALEKCLELNPENSEALMTLAISYINEGYDNAAFATLERWIATTYPDIAEQARQENPTISDEDRFTLHKRVTELFIKAAQLSPEQANMNADVQMGLGVLFYANEDFDKTIDCFKAALSIRPDDPVLWNRLGASLANSNRSEEAVNAYFKALELRPTFVRARYNLGVSCINISCYKEAAEHLLSGLAMHQVEGQESTLSHNQSSSLMETLKRAFIAMDRRDLVELVKPGMDLEQFRASSASSEVGSK